MDLKKLALALEYYDENYDDLTNSRNGSIDYDKVAEIIINEI
jgi:hypothetical protein